MGRPRKGVENRPQLSTRIDPSIKREIEAIVGPFHGATSALVEELIILGLEQYKKKNHDLVEVAMKHKTERSENDPIKLHERSTKKRAM